MNCIPTQINQSTVISSDLSTLPSKTEIDYIVPAPYQSNKLKIPIYSSKVEAGFTSPADDFVEEYLDLNDLLVKHHEATFFVRVSGKSMVDAGIFPGDILIVDRSLTAKDGKIIIANVDGDVTVKRLSMRDGKITLKSESPNHKDITITGELHIWGVVTSVIHQV
jgi:DNA polymerase V